MSGVHDPLDRRRLEDLLGPVAQRLELLTECLDPPLRFGQGLAGCLAAPPLADEVHEVRETPLLGIEVAKLYAHIPETVRTKEATG